MLQMKYLDLRRVYLGKDGFAEIASCVTNIETLKIGGLYDCKFTKKGIPALAQGISKRIKPVSYQ